MSDGTVAHFEGGPLDGQTRILDLPSIFRSSGDTIYVRDGGPIAGEAWYRCLGADERAPAGLPIREVEKSRRPDPLTPVVLAATSGMIAGDFLNRVLDPDAAWKALWLLILVLVVGVALRDHLRRL